MIVAAAPGLGMDGLRSRMEPLCAQLFSDDLERAYAHVDRLCRHLCFRIALDCQLLRCEPETLDRLIDRVGAVPESVYLLRTVLAILCEDGFARCGADGFRALGPCPPDESERLQREARADCREATPIFELIGRCHDCAIDFITGRKSGLAAVFAGGDLGLWERVHGVDRVMSIYADLAAAALEAIARPRMRVLEVGGGVGTVLQRCRGFVGRLEFDEYRFTDLGQVFVQNARRANHGAAPFSFATVDLDLPLRDQGLSPGSFDAVIGVNVLHSAKILRFTLREILHVLKPGGSLILGEGSPPDHLRRWRLDVVFGFLRGWWDISAELPWRPCPGFLTPRRWQQALLECGFATVHLLPGEEWFRGALRGGAVVAQRAAERAEH